MMNRCFLLALLICPLFLRAQEQFIFQGRIEFERRINLLRQIENRDGNDAWINSILPTIPNFHNSNFLLLFNKTKAIYKPDGEHVAIPIPFLFGPAKENVILTDFEASTRTAYKAVFEKKYQLKDSLQNLRWRITGEKRTIAGMDCRKAVTIICDSVYVVAFYADEIPVSGGPESFGGLPGMILGLAIPRLHTTWFATKVILSTPARQDFSTSAKGQSIDDAHLRAQLKSSLSEWGRFADRNMWWILL